MTCVWYWPRYTRMYDGTAVEKLELGPRVYGHLIMTKAHLQFHVGVRGGGFWFLISVAGILGQPRRKTKRTFTPTSQCTRN